MSAGIQHYLSIIALAMPMLIVGCDNNGANGQPRAQMLAQAGHTIVKAEAAVSVETLSDRVIKRQNDYVLYDVRPRADYDIGHIKTAKSIAIMELLSEEHVNQLITGRDVFIYSDYCGRAAQIVTVLRTLGVPAHYLIGGYQAWTDEMYKVAGEGSASEQAKKQAVACWFEGDYIAEAGLAVKSGAGGYVPPLEPVDAGSQEDTLGLGLGIGLGPASEEPEEDSLGLGLGLGLGPEDAQEEKSSSGEGKLIIGEGC